MCVDEREHDMAGTAGRTWPESHFFIYHGPAVRITDNHDGWGLLNNMHCHIASKIPEAKKMHFVWALYGEHEALFSQFDSDILFPIA